MLFCQLFYTFALHYKVFFMKNITLFVALCASFVATAQDDLIRSVAGNQSANAGFQFTTIINLERTDVKDQGSSGTCWSYAGASFIESEMKRMGKILSTLPKSSLLAIAISKKLNNMCVCTAIWITDKEVNSTM